MPQSRRTLSAAAVTDACEAMFAPAAEDLFGLELEWPVHRHGDVSRRPRPDEMGALDNAPLAAGGRVTFEPGGQVELSTAPATSAVEAIEAARIDSQALHDRLAIAGFACATLAVDDRRAPERMLARPRYQAMESFFAARGDAGAWMMTNTASTQINLSHDKADPRLRWTALNRLSPVLLGAFANSPGFDAHGRRWASLRQAIWWSIDPGRTRPVRTDLPPGMAWLEYALSADVMFISDEGVYGASGTPIPPGFTFRRWLGHGHELGWPTIDDFGYHLSTLFPPIRPRGWLELRVLDALPAWVAEVAALTVATACTTDAVRAMTRVLPDTSRLWVTATSSGLADPEMAAAANSLFDVVSANLSAVSGDSGHAEMLTEFRARYVARRRTPGDDLPRELDLRKHSRARVPAGV